MLAGKQPIMSTGIQEFRQTGVRIVAGAEVRHLHETAFPERPSADSADAAD
jgi:hypothetical protein